ncbi:unnamed protein product [Spirodela intermedia]|uniref:Uncharacterized protein n=1 Tax=Spirodela intermedia TaxID=51605 RepID=A0A7I8J3G5_SPIIN|nr:unnamed protein product [Spirodela intermedia]CAA6664757.1 unnamed protein product [Spirodela intermedia]
MFHKFDYNVGKPIRRKGMLKKMPSMSKKPCIYFSVDLHQQFVNALNQPGIDTRSFVFHPRTTPPHRPS